MRAGDNSGAIAAAKLATSAHPNDPFFAELEPLALVTAAAANSDKELAQQAESLYRNLIRRWPNHASYHTGLAVSLATQGRITDGITELVTAHRITPKRIEPLRNLALLEAEIGDLTAAREYLREGVTLAPNDHSWIQVQQQIDASATTTDAKTPPG